MRRPHALLCNLSFLEALSWSSREWSKAREVPLSDRIKVKLYRPDRLPLGDATLVICAKAIPSTIWCSLRTNTRDSTNTTQR